jgi:glucose/arabinose dehydrogenase
MRRLSLVAALFLALCGAVSAASLPPGFSETFVAGLSSPTAIAVAPDGRVFVCEQGGDLRVIKNGALLPTPFVSIVVDDFWERGLLGVAFDPNFVTNQYVYVYYTVPGNPAHNRVSRFTANGDVAVNGSELPILDLPNAGPGNHNGGALHFGLDGKLYIAVGDNATSSNAQTLTNPFGKILRINSNGSIPPDNPFVGQAGARGEIWVLGVRNPFTFGVQPFTGRIFINDVGGAAWEEINDEAKGANYGWPECEGDCNPPDPEFTDPVYFYSQTTGACAIAGGAFYNPQVPQFPAEYTGDYFFADYCGDWIKRIDTVTLAVTTFATGLSSPVDVQTDFEGNLYYLERGTSNPNGRMYKVVYTGSAAPVITENPQNQLRSVGSTATF